MVSIPTPIPDSVVESFRAVWRGSIGDTIWKVSIVVGLSLLGYVLIVTLGVLGGFVGGILLSSLIEDDIREAVKDVWNRDFYEVDT